MNKYKKHIFICENVRGTGSPKQSCGLHGGKEIKAKMKSRIVELGLNKSIRVNTAGCLGQCNNGPIAVVYPKGNWYEKINVDDVEAIIQTDLLGDGVVHKLEIKDGK